MSVVTSIIIAILAWRVVHLHRELIGLKAKVDFIAEHWIEAGKAKGENVNG